jgi:DNA-binding NarL/FixJ family response regulator
MAASAILLVDVAFERPAALKLSRRHPCGLALLEYKMQGMEGVELSGHLRQVHADTASVLLTSFTAAGIVHAASRSRPAGP